jgi:hypothetical protein
VDHKNKLKRFTRPYKGHHRHAIVRGIGNPYREVRRILGINQTKAGEILGITRFAWQYRETRKALFYPAEMCALQLISGLTWEEFGQLLNDIA